MNLLSRAKKKKLRGEMGGEKKERRERKTEQTSWFCLFTKKLFRKEKANMPPAHWIPSRTLRQPQQEERMSNSNGLHCSGPGI